MKAFRVLIIPLLAVILLICINVAPWVDSIYPANETPQKA
jgi:hypothetical protein